MTEPSAVVSPDLVAAALEVADAEERRQATSLIAELLLHDAIPLLVRALGDSDWRVRKEATYASRAFVPAPALVTAMIDAFESSENVGLRNAAIEVAGMCGTAATGPLTGALARLDADGRKLVVQALGATRDPHALVPLGQALTDVDSNVRQGAVEAISRLGPLAPADVQRMLLRSLDGDDPFCQLAALEGLNALGVVVPWEKLEMLLDDPTLRPAALAAASSAEDSRAPEAVVRTLRSARGNVLLLAIAALARMVESPLLAEVAAALEAEGPALGERLLRLAQSETSETQHHRGSALVLAAIAAAPGIVDVVAHALDDELLGEAADRALRLLGPKVLPDLIASISPASGAKTYAADVRAALIEEAAALAHAPCPPDIAARLRDVLRAAVLENDRRITTSALCALSRLGEEQDFALAARFVGATSKPIAHASEAALAVLTRRHPAAARKLADALADRVAHGSADDACVVAVIMGALASLPGASRQSFTARDIALLTRCAAAQDVRTRRTAIEALGGVGGESALSELTLALADDAREVQIAAARALGVIGRKACFRDADESATEASSLRSIVDIVTRSMDIELLTTTIRSLGEDLELVLDEPRSERAMQRILLVLEPLARDAEGAIALAAVEAIGRLPLGARGRQASLSTALSHPDDVVVKAAMLRLETAGASGVDILQCLDHPSFDVRSLAAEIMAESNNPLLRRRLVERTSVELDLNMRDKLEGALSSIRWRGERSPGAS